MQTVIENI